MFSYILRSKCSSRFIYSNLMQFTETHFKRFSCRQFCLLYRSKFGVAFSLLYSEPIQYSLPLPTGEIVEISRETIEKDLDINLIGDSLESGVDASVEYVSFECRKDKMQYFQFKVKGYILKKQLVIDIILSIFEEAANDVIKNPTLIKINELKDVRKAKNKDRFGITILYIIRNQLCAYGMHEEYVLKMEIVALERCDEFCNICNKVNNVLF